MKEQTHTIQRTKREMNGWEREMDEAMKGRRWRVRDEERDGE